MKSLLLTATVLLSSSLAQEDFSVPPSDGSSAEGKTKACEVLFAVDDVLWEKRERNMTYLEEMAQFMVNRLNDIFVPQVFVDDHDELYFRLGRVQVVFGLCDVGYGSENCTQQRGTYLENFDDPRDFSDFCLAYVFTYRDFHNGTAGLASVGTVCQPQRNSGFVTFENYGAFRGMNDSAATFAHEVGHNFNAVHDGDLVEDHPECQGKFIMSGSYDPDTTEELKFSPCSLTSMKEKLDELKEDGTYDKCFKDVSPGAKETEVAVCGNRIVEPGEECDCGEHEQDCWDLCCFPANVLVSDKEADPKNSLSCTKHQLPRCVRPSSLVYGIYVPLAMICLVSLIVGLLLRSDWKNKRRCFSHITQGNVKIVRPGQQPRAQT